MDDTHSQHGRYLGNPTQTALFFIGCVLITFSFSSVILIIYSVCHYGVKQQNMPRLPRQKSSIELLKHKWKSVKSINYPTISSSIFYCLSTASYISALYYFDNDDTDNFGHDLHFVIAILTFVAFIFLAKISIYTQFLARLYNCFKNSYLEPSKCVIRLCIALLTLGTLTIVWWIVLLSLRYVIFKHDFAGYYAQFYFVFSFLFVFDFMVSWLVVGLFIQKLFATLMLKDRQNVIQYRVQQFKEDSVSDSEDRLRDDSQISREEFTDIIHDSIDGRDQRQLDLITKQVILSFIAILTSQLSYVLLLIILTIKSTHGFSDIFQTKLYSIYVGVFYPLDVIINCIVLYFNYKFADRYYQCLCKCCHRRCKQCVLKHITTKIERQFTVDQNYVKL